MNRNLAAAVVLVFALVLGYVLLGTQLAAQGQKPEKAQQWQYKTYSATDGNLANGKAEAEFNKLGAEGWEYVGKIVSR